MEQKDHNTITYTDKQFALMQAVNLVCACLANDENFVEDAEYESVTIEYAESFYKFLKKS